jgi:hypothetical protein
MTRSILVTGISAVLIGANAPLAVLKGTVRDCNGQAEVRVPDIRIAAFNRARNLPMIQLIQSMDGEVLVVSDTAAMRKFKSKQTQLINLVNNSTALARTASDATGEFTLRLPSVDSVFVMAYRDLADEPNYYAYRMVGARNRGTFFIDMSRGACRFE